MHCWRAGECTSKIRSTQIRSTYNITVCAVPCVNTQYMMYIQEGDSALMMAARWGETGVVKELVEGGADLNLQNKVCQ